MRVPVSRLTLPLTAVLRRRPRRAIVVLVLVAAAAAAPLALEAGTTMPSATDVTRLPLGDGHVSTSATRGDIFACRQGPGRQGRFGRAVYPG